MLAEFQAQIRKIWDNQVKNAFDNGLICSERHLQAIIFKEFQSTALIAWVEPKLHGKNIRLIEGYTPNILFTNGHEIIAVMELKYTPYYKLEPQNDLYRLQTFHKEIKENDFYEIYLKINPMNGDWNTQEAFVISKDMLFIYGVVAQTGSKALASDAFANYSPEEILHLKLAV